VYVRTLRFNVDLWHWVMAEARREHRSAANFIHHLLWRERAKRTTIRAPRRRRPG
jgi:hypothetical protein